MPTLQELVDDAKLADTMELTFGENKFTLGDLRAADRSRKEKLSASEKKLQEEMASVAAKQKELTDLAAQAAQLMEKLKGEEKNVPKAKTGDDEIDWDTDPLYSPVGKKFKVTETKLDEVMNSLKTLATAMTDSAKFVLQDYYERRWNSIPEDRRPKDKTWKDYLKVAAEKKILGESGLPDPVEAFNREVEPVERKTLSDENAALKAKIDELEKQSKMPRMPRPGASGAPPNVVDKTGKTYESVDQLVDAAFADPLIQEIAGGGRPA